MQYEGKQKYIKYQGAENLNCCDIIIGRNDNIGCGSPKESIEGSISSVILWFSALTLHHNNCIFQRQAILMVHSYSENPLARSEWRVLCDPIANLRRFTNFQDLSLC